MENVDVRCQETWVICQLELRRVEAPGHKGSIPKIEQVTGGKLGRCRRAKQQFLFGAVEGAHEDGVALRACLGDSGQVEEVSPVRQKARMAMGVVAPVQVQFGNCN